MKTHEQKLAEVRERIRELTGQTEEFKYRYGLFFECEEWEIAYEGCLTLEDVLEAIHKNFVKNKGDNNYVICPFGSFYKFSTSAKSIKPINPAFRTKWVFGKPLSQQSQETIDFLHSLFFNQDK